MQKPMRTLSSFTKVIRPDHPILRIIPCLVGLRYFRTGDLGCMIEKRFLKLTGRVNELYKLENGKFVMPSLIESALGRSNFISQNCVIGANRPYNIALIVPDMVELTNWMTTQKIEIPTDPNEEFKVLHYSEVINLYQSEVSTSPLCRLLSNSE
jgi:long-chain acyl-CoA synthetase